MEVVINIHITLSPEVIGYAVSLTEIALAVLKVWSEKRAEKRHSL